MARLQKLDIQQVEEKDGSDGSVYHRRPESALAPGVGRLALLINGAFVSSSIFEPSEATVLLRLAADALIMRKSSSC